MCRGVDDAKFSIPGKIVEDFTAAAADHALDGCASVTIGAPTVAED